MVGDTVCDAVCVSIMIRYALFGVTVKAMV